MARQKKTTEPALKKQPQYKDPRIQEVYEQEVTFTCPVRGLVTQMVKVKRFKSFGEQVSKHVLQSSDAIDRLEEKDDGLSIYSDGEELGLEKAPESE